MKQTQGHRLYIGPVIATVVLAFILLYSNQATAGQMFLEYHGELTPGYSFFRGAFSLGDLDRDGAEEMVIADDDGGFHVYHFSPAGFVPMWINDPIVSQGFIVDIEIMHENVRGIMPHIFLLDSTGSLHQFRFTGYLFEETAVYENYSPPGESGRLMVTDIGNGDRTVLIAIADTGPDEIVEDPEGPPAWWEGMIIYKLTAGGLVELKGEELAGLEEGEVYFVQNLRETDVDDLHALGQGSHGMFPGSGPDSGLAGLADLNHDALMELLLSVSDPNRPIDRLEIYNEEEGVYTVKITLELPLINEMVLGDIDGDSFTEIVGLTYDGVVLVYQWDPLTVKLADGTEIYWEVPHKRIDDTIWLSLGGFEELGCLAIEGAGVLTLSLNDLTLVLDRTARTITCGEEVIWEEVPQEILESVPFLPLFATLDCLGFIYTWDPETSTVQMEPVE